MTTEAERIERELAGAPPKEGGAQNPALLPVVEGEFRDIRPVVTPEEARAAMRLYQDIAEAITEPDDYQTFTSRDPKTGRRTEHKFRKRAAWKRLERFFFVSVEVRDERIFHDHNPARCLRVKMAEHFKDVTDCGCPIKGVRMWVRALDTRTGRYSDNVGICVLGEPRVPSNASLHDLATRAFNRGANRATADLLGVSDPSAEERQAESGFSKEERVMLAEAYAKASPGKQIEALTIMRGAGARGEDNKSIYIAFLRSGDAGALGSVMAALVEQGEDFDDEDVPAMDVPKVEGS